MTTLQGLSSLVAKLVGGDNCEALGGGRGALGACAPNMETLRDLVYRRYSSQMFSPVTWVDVVLLHCWCRILSKFIVFRQLKGSGFEWLISDQRRYST